MHCGACRVFEVRRRVTKKHGSVLCFRVGFGGRGSLGHERTESESTIYKSD